MSANPVLKSIALDMDRFKRDDALSLQVH